MNAVRWHAAGDVRLDVVDDPPPPQAHQAVVEVAFCGLCGTDVAEFANGPVMIRPDGHPFTGGQPPLTLGHEFSGRVVALGRPVDGVGEGTRVAVDPCWRCGRCHWCVRGEYELCRLGGSVGLASDGALAARVLVPLEGLVPVPDGVSDAIAALAEPLAVGMHGVVRGRLEPGDRIFVQGAGPIGAAVILAARCSGAAFVLVSDPDPYRRELALRLGADEAFDPSTTEVGREVYVRTDRIRADVVFECTGIPELLGQAVAATRRGGRTVLLGIAKSAAELDPRQVVFYEREIIGSLGYRHDLSKVLDLIAAGRLDPQPLISRTIGLEDVPDVLADLSRGRAHDMKVLVDVGGTPAG